MGEAQAQPGADAGAGNGPGCQRKGFIEADYAVLLDAVRSSGDRSRSIWDNLNSYVNAAVNELIVARNWLIVIQIPPYIHELNPAELV